MIGSKNNLVFDKNASKETLLDLLKYYCKKENTKIYCESASQ